MHFVEHEMEQKHFDDSYFGYKDDYLGLGVYLFRNPGKNKWFIMLL